MVIFHWNFFYLSDEIKSNCMYWLHWKSEKNRTEPNELDELKYSKSPNRQTAMLTDVLFRILLLRHVSKHLIILFEISKKIELNELEYWKTLTQMSSYAHKYVFLYLHAHICTKTFINLSHLNSIKKTELKELNEQLCS